ncbi:carboxypeptidase-like regulatory domain-containing protein [Cytophagaceae bacterium YF14B1]|uniref:Carboxypeptidase-like regulatory domain-containing protein n=1 Tax=Xanthocytophaga flava TaxID=3048013 RepID=A0AAE3UA41_9BACT|nr:carboxypeptidase-like regulatory domain-containing protein [Xanthocytophaga flavus]MDJ1482913.1 carboxypeptidase-like regulatory domain-containing protein [Xanthocytophaga flavus]
MQPKYRLTLFLWITLLFTAVSPAMSQESFLTITGRVTSQQTNQPLPYANIGIIGKSLGTVTNAEGNFIFKIPASYSRDSLKISQIGYESVTRAVKDVQGKKNHITLQEAPIQLAEVHVQAKSKTGLEIIKEAIAAIPTNYDTSAIQLLAFYRETIQLDTSQITHTESVLEVKQHPGKEKEEGLKIKTLKERKRRPDTTLYTKDPRFYYWIQLNNGARNTLTSSNVFQVDIKRHKRFFLNSRNFKHYTFTLQGIVSDRERRMYVIEVTPKKKSSKAYIQGKLYIDIQSLAFTQWDLELSPQGIELENNRNFFWKSIGRMVMKASLKISSFKEVLHFDQYQGKWYIKDVRRHFLADVNSKSRHLENSVWKTDLLLTVTDIARSATPETKIYTSADSVSQKLNKSDFWGQFNIIQPASKDTLGTVDQKIDSTSVKKMSQATPVKPSNRENGFTRADTLRGKLTPLRTCYDVIFYKLDLDVDIERKFISGSTLVQFSVQQPFTKMQVDLYDNMQIHQIVYKGKTLPYTREYNAVFIQFPETLPIHTNQEITIQYSGNPKEPNRDISMDGGFLWSKDANGDPWVQVVCQGSGASLWWPNKDHLSDEPDSVSIAVTVPQGLLNISNGRLRKTTQLSNHKTRYEWFVSYPINNYNVTLNIGKYAHLQGQYITSDTLTLDFYVMPYNLEKGKIIFDRIKPMLATLEKQYGKYPFPRDGFKLMESLHAMEHQSAVSFGKMPEGDSEEMSTAPLSIVWHEVSHEWWGNQVSCSDLADMWIHEAFATYSESLPFAEKFGKKGEQEYMESITGQVIEQQPIIGVYDVNHIHYNIGDMYEKGALMLYTFKNVLNNDACWVEILQGIQQDFRNKTVCTNDIVHYINTKTNTDYTYFFDQYLRYTSIPALSVKYKIKGSALILSYKWIADVADFRMPIRVTTAREKFGLIYPTTQWKTLTLPNMEPTDFDVDDTQFYVNVEEEEIY